MLKETGDNVVAIVPRNATASVQATPGHKSQYRGLGCSALEYRFDMAVYETKPGIAASVLFADSPNAIPAETRYGPRMPLPESQSILLLSQSRTYFIYHENRDPAKKEHATLKSTRKPEPIIAGDHSRTQPQLSAATANVVMGPEMRAWAIHVNTCQFYLLY